MTMKKEQIIIIFITLVSVLASVLILIFALGNGSAEKAEAPDVQAADADSSQDEAAEDYTPADMSAFADLVPPLREGYSEFTGPWAYVFYAKDEGTDYIYHDAYDGYVPKAGDLLVLGDDDDEIYVDRRSKRRITGLGMFEYWVDDYAWNGHIIYVAENNDDVLKCYEGNAVAPGQTLDTDADDYIYRSSIDMIEIDFESSIILTPDKTTDKTIRAVIETSFPEELVNAINYNAGYILNRFNDDPDKVRSDIMSLYPEDIDWCGLYIHYLLLKTVSGL